MESVAATIFAELRTRVPALGEEHSFEFWARMPQLRLEEAAELMLGRLPDATFLTSSGVREVSPSLAHMIALQFEVLKRAVKAGELTRDPSPAQLRDWANTREISLPEEFASSIPDYLCDEPDEHVHQLIPLDSAASNSNSRIEDLRKQNQTLMCMLAGIAKEKLRYDPASRNDAAKVISDITQRSYGIEITPETIRNHLKRADAYAEKLGKQRGKQNE